MIKHTFIVFESVFVDGVDGASGKNIMELVEQQQLPETVEFGARVSVLRVVEACNCRKRFDFLQEKLTLAVSIFRLNNK